MRWICNRVRKLAISAFIIIYVLFALTLWLEESSAQPPQLLKVLKPAVMRSGLWQCFNFFSPEPFTSNLTLEAKIKYADGSTKTWQYPKLENMGLIDRVLHARWGSYRYWQWRSSLWPDFAVFIARQCDSPGKHPISVMLVRSWVDIRPPDARFPKAISLSNGISSFYTRRIWKADLR